MWSFDIATRSAAWKIHEIGNARRLKYSGHLGLSSKPCMRDAKKNLRHVVSYRVVRLSVQPDTRMAAKPKSKGVKVESPQNSLVKWASRVAVLSLFVAFCGWLDTIKVGMRT